MYHVRVWKHHELILVHLPSSIRKQDLINLKDLDTNTRETLALRSGIEVHENDGTLCLHHEQVLIEEYEWLQNFRCCSDPKKRHGGKKKVKTNLKTLSLDDVKTINIIKHVSLKPGEKLCFHCFKKLNEEAAEVIKCQAESSESSEANEPTCTSHLGSSGEFD